MGIIKHCSIRGVDILIDVDSEDEDRSVRNYEMWRIGHYADNEPDTLDWIDTNIRPGDTVYDIGANIGQYALYAAKRLGGEVRVLAFEPEALNFAKLNRNIVLNGLTETVVAYPIAISDRTAVDTFYTKTFAAGASLHALGRPVTQGEVAFEPRNHQGTVSITLDDMLDRFGLPVPGHLKVDVDGHEAEIVNGARNLLGRPELKSVLIEVFMHGDAATRIRAAFEDAGFRLCGGANADIAPGTVRNLVFTRPQPRPRPPGR